MKGTFDPEYEKLRRNLDNRVIGATTSGWFVLGKRGKPMKLRGGKATAISLVSPLDHYNGDGKLSDPANWDVVMANAGKTERTHIIQLTSLLSQTELSDIFSRFNLEVADKKFALKVKREEKERKKKK